MSTKIKAFISGLVVVATYVFVFQAGFVSSRWAIARLTGGFNPKVQALVESTARVLKVEDDAEVVLCLAGLDPVPVFVGASSFDLSHGASWIPGTARPGELGNVGIAGDHERHFHGLYDLTVGDFMDLYTVYATRSYVVDDFSITRPGDMSALNDRGFPSLTLVIAYTPDSAGQVPMWLIIRGTLKSPNRLQFAYFQPTRRRWKRVLENSDVCPQW